MPLQISLMNPISPPWCNPSSDNLPGRDLFILIDSTLFCIHKYFFEWEATKFFIPPYTNPDNNTPQRTFTSHPIMLHDISIYNFKQFLWVFYNPQLSLYNNTIGNWWSIGCLAGLWGFDEVLNLVNSKLEKFEDVLYQRSLHCPTHSDQTQSDFYLAGTPAIFQIRVWSSPIGLWGQSY